MKTALSLLVVALALPVNAQSLEVATNNLELKDKLQYFSPATELLGTVEVSQPAPTPAPIEIPTSLGFNLTMNSMACRFEAKPAAGFKALLAANCGIRLGRDTTVFFSNYNQESWNRMSATITTNF
jgi:hypothetical protein